MFVKWASGFKMFFNILYAYTHVAVKHISETPDLDTFADMYMYVCM